MPYYDFHCERCEHDFEMFFSVSDDRKSLKCPKCGSKKVERVFGNISMGVSKGMKKGHSCSDGSCSSCCSDCGH